MVTDYENPWLFNGRPFKEEHINGYEGFVYLIKNTLTDQFYIGRKYFWDIRKPHKTKKNPNPRRKRTMSNWKDYYGSSLVLKEDVATNGIAHLERYILSLHTTRGDCNRTEIEYLWKTNALYETKYINDSIGNHRVTSKKILEAREVASDIESLLGIKI